MDNKIKIISKVNLFKSIWLSLLCFISFAVLSNQPPRVISAPSYTIDEDSYQQVQKSHFDIVDVDSTSTGVYLDNGANYTHRNHRVYPKKDFHGTLLVNYRVVDNNGGITRGTLTIKVKPVNDAPRIISAPSYSIDEDSYQQVQKSHFDIVDVDSTSTGVYLDNGANYTHRNHRIYPKKDFHGTLLVNYRVVDNNGGITRGKFTIKVKPVNDAPRIISAPSYTIDEDSYQQVQKSHFDIVDVDSTSTGVYLDNGANYTHRNYRVYPKKDFHGTLLVNYRVVDNNGGITRGKFTIKVKPVNDAPQVISAPSYLINKGTFQQVYKSDFTIVDVDSASTGLYLDQGSNYTLSAYEVHPHKGFCGILPVNYRVVDNHGGEFSGSFDITVSCDSSIEAADDFVAVAHLGEVKVNPLNNDIGNSPNIVSIKEMPMHGDVVWDRGSNEMIYSHTDAGFCGTDTFSYKIQEGNLFDIGKVHINIIDCPVVNTNKILGVHAGLNYGAVIPDPNGEHRNENDLDSLIKMIVNSNANTYNYRFSHHNPTHWNYFETFLKKLHKENPQIQVIAYLDPELWLMPFAYNKKGSNDRCDYKSIDGPERAECNATDLVVWVKEINNLKLKLENEGIDNLIGVAIDDYDRVMEIPCDEKYKDEDEGKAKLKYDCENNPTKFDLEYTKSIKNAAGDLLFIPVVYFRNYEILRNIEDYIEYIDGIIFPVLFNETTPHTDPIWGELLYKTSMIKEQLRYLKRKMNGKKVIPLLYATGYPKNINTSPEYLLEVGDLSYKNADGVMIYHLQTEYMARGWPRQSYKWREKRELTKTLFSRLNGNSSPVGITSVNYITGYSKDYMYEALRLTNGETESTSSLKFVSSGDFDASEFEETIAAYDDNGYLKLISYDANVLSHYENNSGVKESINNYSIDSTELKGSYPKTKDVQYIVAGDYFGRGHDQMLAFMDYPNGTQEIIEYNRARDTINMRAVYSTTNSNFDFDEIKFMVSGNFNSTESSSVVALRQSQSVQQMSGFINSFDTMKLVNWSQGGLPKSEIDFDNILHVTSGNFTGDDRDELALVVSEFGQISIYVYGIINEQMVRLGHRWFNVTERAYGFSAISHFTSGNFDHEPYDELILYCDYPESNYYKIMMLHTDSHSNFEIKQSTEGDFWKKTDGSPPAKISSGVFYSNQDESSNSVIYFQ